MCSSGAHANPGASDDDLDAIDSSGPSLEVDSDDRDSALGDNQSAYTMSATSSVYNFRYENGRRYHAYAEGKYPVPNDEIEKDRLDLQHQAFRLTLDGRLYCAPIAKDVQHVLDVGCGTGIWTIEFADEHPSASIIGTDLSPIQPTAVPPNCQFLIDDCDQEWLFHNKFDYVHTRAMVAAIKDWDRFFEQAYANLKPGGWLECQEISFPALCMDKSVTSEESPILRWSDLFIEAAAKTGLNATAPQNFAANLRAAGFVDIHAKNHKWPIGRWAKGSKMKLLGYYVYEDVLDWLPSSALGLFTRVLKWSREEVELFLADCRRELKGRKDRHYFANTYFWTARKPEDASTTNFDAEDFVKDEESLEADDTSQASTGPPLDLEDEDVTAAAEPVSSTGVLVDTTAELFITSPPPQEKGKEVLPPPTASSESRRSMLSFEEMLNPAPVTSSDPAQESQTTLVEDVTAPQATLAENIPAEPPKVESGSTLMFSHLADQQVEESAPKDGVSAKEDNDVWKGTAKTEL